MRQRLCLDRNWRFALGHAANPALDFEFARDRSLVKSGEARGAAKPDFDDSGWRLIDLPHDWAIELPLDPHGDKELAEHGFHAIGPDHPEHSVGWYRRTFEIPESDLGRRIWVEFDGVFRDSVVWINGHRLGRHASGYIGFRYDLTDLLNYGGKNVLAVRVDATNWEGWWYEGAGIYRHVWLVKTDPLHVAPHGTFVTSQLSKDHSRATITIRTTVLNQSDEDATFDLRSEISELQPQSSNPRKASPLGGRSATLKLQAWSQIEVVQQIELTRPRLWSPEEPNLYTLRTRIEPRSHEGTKRRFKRGNRFVSSRLRGSVTACDEVQTTFGVRSMRWDPKRGFFLNGKHLKIKGTCNHQQHAGVGIAVPDRLHEWRIRKLKEMGSNAYRCSHYPVAPELLDACDRLGMLVMAENRLADTGPQFLDNFRSMILRDRNHPSIILWSIGNEEHTIQWSVTGERIGRTLVRIAHELDPTRAVTAAMHDRGLGEGFANVVDVHGWNYIKVGDIEKYHRLRPDRPIVGSEEGSTVTTRGIYADDKSRGYVSAYDLRTPKWGSTAESWWTFFAARPWLAGGFVWTGFDYKGEPIPYRWPCTSSHFGLMDLCGFPKDIYWYYRAWWGSEPVLHLFPHWNWMGMEGREIDVRAFSNCQEVELLLNGRSLGRQRVRPNSHVAWKVVYEPGTLEAHGYVNGKIIRTSKVETTGEPKQIVLRAESSGFRADGHDVCLIRVSVVDEQGRQVPTADNLIHFQIEGPARLLGVGNGDPSSHESDRAPFRRLFNGLAQVILGATHEAGTVTLTASSPGLSSATLKVRATRSPSHAQNRRTP
ncbi:beta-galactosidase GalA [Fontivita pretiosa]|uniref:beta-galactosidase GalA n=1 Tax=Fontivita pretiosa TaxID=2989684 RepID=UPI003D176D6C